MNAANAEIRATDAAEAVKLCAALLPAEREVLVLTSNGYTANQVAELIQKNHKTVVWRLSAVRVKLGVETTIEAAVIACKAGLV